MNDDPRILFQSGPLSVTPVMLRFRGRRYALRHIENLVLTRALLWMALALSGLLVLMAASNTDILYVYEMLVLLVLAAALPIVAWPLGTLQIHSRLLSTAGGSITWLHRDLTGAMEVVEYLAECPNGDEDRLSTDPIMPEDWMTNPDTARQSTDNRR